ncbi:MAG: hypothetical protein ACFE85_11910 [Candidatus Hodarchaeota archaeon]
MMHTFLSLLLYYLAFKVIKRNRNRITLALGAFYFFPATGFLLNLIFLPFSSSLGGYILYFSAAFLILFGFIFLILFIINLLNMKMYYSIKKQLIIVIIYGLADLILLLWPGGITINEQTNWTPSFSIQFFIISYLFFTLVISFPSILLSIKLYHTFTDKRLKKKFGLFLIGIIGMFSAFYGLILYNTSELTDAVIILENFKSIWTVLVFCIVIPSGLLIYYGIGQNL